MQHDKNPPPRAHTENIKVAARVAICFGFVSVMMVLGTALGIDRMSRLMRNLDAMNVNDVQSRLASEMYLTVTERALAMRNLIMLTDEYEIQLEIDRIEAQTEKYAYADRQLRAMLENSPETTAGEREKLDQIREVAAASAPYIASATALALSGRGQDAYQLLRFEFRPTQKKWWRLLRELIELQEERNRNATIEAGRAYRHARSLMLGFGTLSLLLCGIAAYLIMRVERRLQSSEQAFRTLAENSPDMIVRFDRDFRRVLINPAYYREIGIAPGGAQNKTVDEFWHAANVSAEEYKAILRKVMETGVSANTLLESPQPGRALVAHDVRIVPERGLSGQVVGALAIGRNISELKEAERRLVQSHAQLHALSVHREVVQEEERKSIARELHDELGQILTALHMRISVLRIKFGNDHPALLEHVLSLSRMADTMMQVVRRVVSNLRPAALDMGIASGLEWLVDEFSQHSGIDCKLFVEEKDIALNETCAVAIFRIVQESLTNVARHAHASLVEVRLWREGEHYFLRVNDNGRGFDPDAPRPRSFGIAGVRERALSIGGAIAVTSAPGKGTTLNVHFPIEENAICL